MAQQVHHLLASIDQHEIEIGNHLAFSGTEWFADQFTFGRDDCRETAAGDWSNAASGVLHDLRLLFGIQPRRCVDDETAGFKGVLADIDLCLLGKSIARE